MRRVGAGSRSLLGCVALAGRPQLHALPLPG